ncbi:MAG: Rrf2 family transcriptional regulator [Bdellovibrionaceae bacterium]|nr:Rrf2 family transcriptional regulator [Pseudobdellovibrionaceae bacterium]NUM60303.1 Rrf2 family transcriptional regulator [Pseudobdellovibrionaceae bacterium]
MSYTSAFSQAIVTVVFIGDKVQQKIYEFVPTSAISKSLNLKSPTLVKILNLLYKAGIIETKEGKLGGVRLKIPPEKVTLLDLFKAIEADKPLFQIHLNLTATGNKPDRVKKELQITLSKAEIEMKDYLKSVTIADFIKKLYF